MISLLKGFAVFVAATLGTTAAIGNAPRAPHHHPVAALAAPALPRVPATSPADLHSEQDQLHIRALHFVPPPPAPEPPAEPPPSDPAVAAPEAGQGGPAAPRAFAPAPPAPAPAPQISIGSAQQALINSDRAAAGLAPLSWSGCLAGIAAGQDAAMVAAGRIFHGAGVSQDFGCGLGSAQTGENVGYWSGGINDGQLNVMFMNSPEHRANIMGPYRFVGTAWRVGANGNAYIAVEFA